MRIVIVGIGGRTGTMFAFELQKVAEVLGIGRTREVKMIQEKRLYVRKDGKPFLFEGKVIQESEFSKDFLPEMIFFAIKNPVGPAIRYYYQKIKDEKKLPDLILSQNGIVAIREAEKTLRDVLGKRIEEVRITRVSLFNPVDIQESNGKFYVDYFSPVRIAFSIEDDSKEKGDIKEVFGRAGIEAEEIPWKKVESMEFSKLFMNLIGMASASKSLSIEKGLEDKETFKEEIMALREYIKVVRRKKGGFLNFRHYPIKLFAFLTDFLPIAILSLFREKLARVITKEREGKLKGNLDEIDYYNGEIIKLGKELGIDTPFNQKIYQKMKERLLYQPPSSVKISQ